MAKKPDCKPSINPSFGFQMVISGIKARFPAVRNMSTEELQRLINQHDSESGNRVVIVDVRLEEEHYVSHIPTAIRVDPQTQDMMAVMRLVQDKVSDESRDEPIKAVMYCSVGYRSSALANRFMQLLRDENRNRDLDTSHEQTSPPSTSSLTPKIHVYNLEGSLFKWANENRALVDGLGNTTKFVHPYSIMWGQLVSKDIRKWEGPRL